LKIYTVNSPLIVEWSSDIREVIIVNKIVLL